MLWPHPLTWLWIVRVQFLNSHILGPIGMEQKVCRSIVHDRGHDSRRRAVNTSFLLLKTINCESVVSLRSTYILLLQLPRHRQCNAIVALAIRSFHSNYKVMLPIKPQSGSCITLLLSDFLIYPVRFTCHSIHMLWHMWCTWNFISWQNWILCYAEFLLT